MQTVEHWTDAEVRNMRRCIAYHQHRLLRTVSTAEARAVMDEQQRRRDSLFHDHSRWHPGGGWFCAGDKHPCNEGSS